MNMTNREVDFKRIII